MNIIITFSFNRNYIKYCNALCDSIQKNIKQQHSVYARCVNISDIDLQQLKNKYKNYVFVDDRLDLCTELKYHKNDLTFNHSPKSIITDKRYRKENFNNGKYVFTDTRRYSEETVYTCHSRFNNLKDIIDHQESLILCLDVDSIINKDLCDIVDEIGDNDIMIYKNTSGEYTEEGCFVIKCDPQAKLFVNKIIASINHDPLNWDIDGSAIKEHIHTLKSCQLNVQKYKNKNFAPEATIWSGDEHAKNNIKYKKILC